MFTRTIKGLTLSIGVGVTAASLSSNCPGSRSSCCHYGRVVDTAITWMVDLVWYAPPGSNNTYSLRTGGGMKGVIVGAAHRLAQPDQVIRAEAQLRAAEFTGFTSAASRYCGYPAHLPHVMPQLFVGLIRYFPCYPEAQ